MEDTQPIRCADLPQPFHVGDACQHAVPDPPEPLPKATKATKATAPPPDPAPASDADAPVSAG